MSQLEISHAKDENEKGNGPEVTSDEDTLWDLAITQLCDDHMSLQQRMRRSIPVISTASESELA